MHIDAITPQHVNKLKLPMRIWQSLSRKVCENLKCIDYIAEK